MCRFFFIFLFTSVSLTAAASTKNFVCYFASWATHRPGNGKFAVSDINPNFCTHILYSFVGLEEDGSIKFLGDASTETSVIEALVNLKEQNSEIKILLSMGGWNEGSSTYSHVAANSTSRLTMVTSVVEFLEKYALDGFDLDWEYPCQRGGSDEDKANFAILLGELKSALGDKGLILSAAVAGQIEFAKISYDIPGVSRNVDMLNIMTYDFHTNLDGFVGHNAPLYASHLDQTEAQKSANVNASIQYWLDNGADPSKINLGLATYGRGFTLTDSTNTSLYASVKGGSEAGPYTDTVGLAGYNEICEFHNDWEQTWDDEQEVPHIVNGSQWIGFDDNTSVELKIKFLYMRGLGGIMVWSIDTDDFRGLCYGVKNSLLNTIHLYL